MLIVQTIQATILIVLHFSIAGFGFNFAMQYEAAPDSFWFARIGTWTWLLVTPVLYFFSIVLCIRIGIQIRNEKTAES